MELTNIVLKDNWNGNRHYSCVYNSLLIQYETNGITEKHMDKCEFIEMIKKSYEYMKLN